MEGRRSFVTLFFLVLLSITIYPVFAAAPGTIIDQSATLYIGEQGLDVTHALNQAQGSPVDGIPANTSIGWWASGTPVGPPSNYVDLSKRYTSLTVEPADFVGYTGNWYVLEADGFTPMGLAFTVADPRLDIRVWDFDHAADVTGTAVPRGTHLGFRIDTNMYGATSRRTPLNPATDGFIDIRVTDESSVTYPALYHYSTNEGTLAGPGSLLANYVNDQPYYWGSPSLAWNTSAVDNGAYIYPEGTYTVQAESTLHNMRANYQNYYADFVGKTVSAIHTVTIISESPEAGGGGGTEAGSTAGGTTSSVATVPGVAAGAAATFPFAPVITGTAPAGVTGVQLVTTRALGQMEITVTNLPTGTLTGLDQPVAGNMDIVAVGINPNAIDHATITFSVYKDWLTEQGFTPSDIVGAYDNKGVWTYLPTTYTGETGNSCTFTMTTEKLGYFAITVSKPGIAPAIKSEQSPAATMDSQSYSLGFAGLSFNADGQGTLDISLADAQAAGATVTIYLNRIEVYQHHSPGVTITFWGDNFTITRGRIAGKVSRAEFVTDPLNATLRLGNVSGSVQAVLPSLTTRALINNTISENVSAGTLAQSEEIAKSKGLNVTSVAFTFTVNKVNLTTGPANVTFSLPASWVDAHGGRDSVRITRISDETGRKDLLNTLYVGTDARGIMTFRGDSPDGTSLFGLITAEATAARQREQPNITYVPASKPAMVTNVGMFGWLAGILFSNPLLILVVIAALVAALYFGWWRRRL